ncbi:hypothetical protein F3Y22_tig00116997pilonHSYRG00660 [Hibiscus syriacus]|uniref:C2H2-type domain-containing protein n=1 Tax=Hibiscus syriacus TaxID=106335 RepID=A0A6A2WGK6_HIBSY|nr:hypothetical protein F3Y22_tig00116997pilonHSYRG00660 [Hibiscus syriacus]
MDEEKGERESGPIFKDIRRYFCDHCGICRSKKSLITSHILTYHPGLVLEKVDHGGKEEEEIFSLNRCQECGATFRKPAHLKHHLQSHFLVVGRPPEKLHQVSLSHAVWYLKRPFVCSFDDCHVSYRRKDHLNRNMKRHVKEFHAEDSPSPDAGNQKQYVCQEVGCGKVFKFASKLRKHEDSHGVGSEKIKCDIEGCLHTFSTKSNMRQHVKAVHEELESFACSFSGCGMRFAYKHVRDNHEKSTRHVYVPGDFIESPMSSFDQGQGVGGKEHAPPWKCLLEKELLHQKWIQ